ncbi:MAG: inositol monophosphatase [Bacteroidales bacterium]|nr:inositol monophosphatase [Bacteroidales bacterium]
MDYGTLCQAAIQIVKDTGVYIRTERQSFAANKVEEKGIHNFVSYVDKEAERRLVEGFKGLLPSSFFITEEDTVEAAQGEFTWIIDPLDGTTNFIHNLPPFAISVALQHHQETVLGIIYEVTGDECYYSWKGARAYLNGTIIQCSQTSRVHDSLIATGFPYYDYERMKSFLHSLEYFMRNSHGVRRLGSAATDLAYVACGRFEGFYEYGLSPWDVAAGAFLVTQAGGRVCDYRLGDDYIFGKEIIASNNGIFQEFSTLLADMYQGKHLLD